MLPLLLLAAACCGGTALTLLWDLESPLSARLAAGAATGLALLSLVGFSVAAVVGQSPLGEVCAALAVLSPALLLRGARLERLRPARPALVSVVGFALGGLLLAAVFDRAYFERPDGIYTGHEHNLGDLPFHLALVTGFAFGDNLPPAHPELSGAALTYPFLADFGVAQLVRAGASLHGGMQLHNLALALAALVLLHRMARRLTGDALAALIAPALLLFSGGFGFVDFLADAARGEGVVSALGGLTRDYTITRTGELRFGNVLLVLLTTQRSLLLGLPLALSALTLVWEAASAEPERDAVRRMAGAGFLAGILPLAHAHSLAVLLAMGACLALLVPRRRAWAAFFGVALALALPQLLWLASGSALRAGGFLAFEPGWDSGGRNLVAFWLRNAGLFLPLAVLGTLRAPHDLRRFTAPFFLLFLVPNLLRLSPWIWDNIKLLFFWQLLSLPPVALLLARLWRSGRAGRVAAPALLVLLTFSGGLDLWRVVSRQVELRIFDADAVAFGERELRLTPPRALVLGAPTYDSPVFLSGRRTVLGYPGHVWSQGLAAGAREAEIARIYEGAVDAETLLRRHAVDFILVGPRERASYRLDEAFLDRYPLVAERGPYALRRAR